MMRSPYHSNVAAALMLVVLGALPAARAHPNSFESNIDLNIRITETALIFDFDTATFLFPPLEDVKFGLVAPKPSAADRAQAIEAFVAEKCSVVVDGVAVKPKLTELVYDENPQGMHLNKVRPMIYALMSFHYPLKTKPREIRIRWGIFLDIPDSFYETLTEPELFGEDLSELNPQVDAYGVWETAYFAPIEPEFIWHSPEHRKMPPAVSTAVVLNPEASQWSLPLVSMVVAVALGGFLVTAFIRKWPPAAVIPVLLAGGCGIFLARDLMPVSIASLTNERLQIPGNAEAVDLFKRLHANIYRAFDYDREEDVYDALAQSVDGALLEKVYNEVYQALIMREQGGAVSKVHKVDVLECVAKEVTGGDSGETRFDVACHWRVHGMVTHNGHSHRRINEYRAKYQMAPRAGQWKVSAAEVSDQQRVYSRDLQKQTEAGTPDASGAGELAPEVITAQQAKATFLSLLDGIFDALNAPGKLGAERKLDALVENTLTTHVYNELLERIRAEEEDERDCVFISGKPQVRSCRVYEVTEDGETRFRVTCDWTVTGTVEVAGTKRPGKHAFEANFEMAYREATWKITDLQLDDHNRLDPDKATTENAPAADPSPQP